MKLKNYTSSVPVERTVARIEAALISAGATGITKDYEEGELRAVCFHVRFEERIITIRLPAQVDEARKVFLEGKKRIRRGTLEKVNAQAARTAWKLIQDWVEIQVSMIRMKQAEFMQVFLPYIWDGHTTYFDYLKVQKFKSLPSGAVTNKDKV